MYCKILYDIKKITGNLLILPSANPSFMLDARRNLSTKILR